MITTDYVRLMASYNRWQNQSIYRAAAGLSDAQRRADNGAFFGSIHATLNHCVWADQLWLSRFTDTPPPLYPDIPGSVGGYERWEELQAVREQTDATIQNWANKISNAELSGSLSWYSGAMQADIERPKGALIMHMFNHGTHHRGQVHAMLTANGAKPDDTDLSFMPDAHWIW